MHYILCYHASVEQWQQANNKPKKMWEEVGEVVEEVVVAISGGVVWCGVVCSFQLYLRHNRELRAIAQAC